MTRKEYKELVNTDLFHYYGKDDLCTSVVIPAKKISDKGSEGYILYPV